MSFLLVGALLVAGVISVLIGALAGSPLAFGFAAICSAIAVVLLWRHTKTPQEKTFVTNPPMETEPNWDRPLRKTVPIANAGAREQIVVAIDDYDELLAAEILPSLETLSIDQLEAVIRRERAGLGRVAVLNRAQSLIDLTKQPESEEIVIAQEAPIPANHTRQPRQTPPRKNPTMPRRAGTPKPNTVRPTTSRQKPQQSQSPKPRKKGPDLGM